MLLTSKLKKTKTLVFSKIKYFFLKQPKSFGCFFLSPFILGFISLFF
ncbi:hypothetical protein AB751O23_AC_00150 [Chlamydiales bacterium SCGC AB-751-O23]|nr:hypothetical protein AB751O23_AC_00150 [Chlamydiales bacterium SCGC AB-751-O23]